MLYTPTVRLCKHFLETITYTNNHTEAMIFDLLSGACGILDRYHIFRFGCDSVDVLSIVCGPDWEI